MPKTEIKEMDAREKIALHLEEKGTMQRWLAKQVGMSDTHLHFILKCERDLTDENLQKINEVLGTDF